jgi:DNA-binding transcriptional regulator YdaS (Cro superfamily)
MHDIRPLIAEAVQAVGSQGKLARAAGCSQQFIWKLLQGERKNITVDLALRIQKATGGKVQAVALRPDAAEFLPPIPQSSAA